MSTMLDRLAAGLDRTALGSALLPVIEDLAIVDRCSRPISLESDAPVRREYPQLVKPLAAPILAFANQTAESMTWSWIVDHAWSGGVGYTMLYSTDHAATHTVSGIYRATADSPLGPWTPRGRVFRDDTDGSQTETPSVVWDSTSSLWRMYYQQTGVSGTKGIQSTLMATSSDLITWTRVGVVLDRLSSSVPGDGHTGYPRPFKYSGSWFMYSLFGGSGWGGQALWQSSNMTTWRQVCRIGYGTPWLTHLPGYDIDWRIKWLNSSVIDWRGRAWLIVPVGPTSAGGNANPNLVCAAPLSADLQSIAGLPINITPAAQAWETNGVEGLGNAITSDGRLFLTYRASGQQGSFGIMEIV